MESSIITVMVVDDSQIYRKTLEHIFDSIPDVSVVASAWNGAKAIEYLKNNKTPHLITLDIEMPEMNGIETLIEINKIYEEGIISELPLILMISSLTHEGAKATIKAIQNGAFDFITKPTSNNAEETHSILKSEISKRILMIRKKIKGQCLNNCIKTGLNNLISSGKTITNRNAIALGSSAGGTKALFDLLPTLSQNLKIPIFITTGLQADFLDTLKNQLNEKCHNKVVIASENLEINSPLIYLAPIGKHLILRKLAGKIVCGLTDNPPENNAKPSFDTLLRAMNMVYGGEFFAIFLAGSGSDGTNSLPRLKRAGVYVIAQDHSDTGICELPSAAIATGCVDQVIPLEKIPEIIEENLKIN